LKPHAPRIITVKIPVDKIGALIGPGGKNIRALQEETGVKIDIEEDGTVYIASTDAAWREDRTGTH
jgi:polyribonucleotide nucleotidyltransferase